MSRYDYLLLPRLEIQAANAQAAWWLINAAPVMAANLFAHHLGLKTGRRFPQSVGIVHHDAQLLGERFYRNKLHPQQRRGAVFIDKADYPEPRAGEKRRPILSLQPTASCHLSLSLVLAFSQSDGLPSLSRVQGFLAGARLAGGQILRHSAPQALDTAEAVRQALRSGAWLVERMDLLESATAGDSLDALIAACARRTPVAGDAAAPEEAGGGWIVPATLGYATLTGFAARGGAREGKPHAYAEPLVGLVQYVSLRDWAERPLPLWHGHWPREDVFVVTQQGA